jgi:hypothetical protein
MGEQFLRKQAHGFRHRHDAAFDRMKIPDLICATRQDVMTREFRCDTSSARIPPDPGSDVVLSRLDDGGIAVLAGSQVVGAVASGEVASLAPVLNTGCGLLRARVASRSAVTPSFVVRLQVSP